MIKMDSGKFYKPIRTSQIPSRQKIAQRIWEVVWFVCCRPSMWFMHAWRRFFVRLISRLMGGTGISRRACFMPNSRIDYPWNIIMGHSSVDNGAWIYALEKITIGDNVCIGEGVKLLSGSHQLESQYFDLITKPITIKDNVWIATDAIILPGVTIGEGAVVAAGAVVSKDVEPWTVVGGNPARFIKKRVLKG